MCTGARDPRAKVTNRSLLDRSLKGAVPDPRGSRTKKSEGRVITRRSNNDEFNKGNELGCDHTANSRSMERDRWRDGQNRTDDAIQNAMRPSRKVVRRPKRTDAQEVQDQQRAAWNEQDQ